MTSSHRQEKWAGRSLLRPGRKNTGFGRFSTRSGLNFSPCPTDKKFSDSGLGGPYWEPRKIHRVLICPGSYCAVDANEVVWIAVHMKQDVALSDVKPMRMEFGDTNASLLQDVMLNIVELTPCSLKE